MLVYRLKLGPRDCEKPVRPILLRSQSSHAAATPTSPKVSRPPGRACCAMLSAEGQYSCRPVVQEISTGSGEFADRSGQIAGVVLAAGTSSRMGRNKLLFDVAGEPLVRRTVRTAIAGGLDPILVVLGYEPEAVRNALAELPCRFVANARYADGMNSSVCAGFEAIPRKVVAGVVLLADMPLVDADMIAALVSQYRASEA